VSVVVWRLCAAKYADRAFDGEGARLNGGRWSLPGLAIVYTSESRALAAMEVLANVDEPSRLFLNTWVLVPAVVPDDAIERPARFPETWRDVPRAAESALFGVAWTRERRSAALRVPSVIVPGEFNYLLNPAHADFKQVKIGKPESFTFDPRLR
jgi:RES domain-containing protein